MTPQKSVNYWLKERLRDILLWPLNLVRDFPRRSLRLLQTFKSALLGLIHSPADAVRATKNKRLKEWLLHKTKHFAHGLHLLSVQLFDLIGGPEIAQFFMHLFSHTSPLTPEEITLISAILKPNHMRYQDIRVAEGGLLEKVFQVNGRLAFTTWYTINLPQETTQGTNHTRSNKALMVHELFHTFQNEKVGTRYMTEAIYVLIKTKRHCYHYGGPAGLREAHQAQKQFQHFNREQQAQIIQDYYSKQCQQADTTAYAPYLHQLHKGLL